MPVAALGTAAGCCAHARSACSPVHAAGPARARVAGGVAPPARAPAAARPTRRTAPRCQAAAVAADAPARGAASEHPPLRVIVAGGGIGGLLMAAGLLKRGFDVVVLERDLTSIKGEGKYRGPIQIQSNALAALEAVDEGIAEQVCAGGCATGDRINGLCDGVTGDWYVKFDTYHPAVDNGLPVTRVICRYELQRILAEAVIKYGGEEAIVNNVQVADYVHETDPSTGAEKVTAVAEDGRRWIGDVLVGADGIRSKARGGGGGGRGGPARVRVKMVGDMEPTYSEYTCYTGIADYTPADIDTVAYRVFLGHNQYFVTSDVGEGKTQWYGFHCEPPGGEDAPGRRKQRLLQIFGHWSDMASPLPPIPARPCPGFDESLFPLFMTSDDALLRALRASWLLVPASAAEEERLRTGITVSYHNGVVANGTGNGTGAAAGDDLAAEFAAHQHQSPVIDEAGVLVGSGPGTGMAVAGAAPRHALLARADADYYVTDLGSEAGTWVNGRRIPADQPHRLLPGDLVRFGPDPLASGAAGAGTSAAAAASPLFKVKLQHASIAEGVAHGAYDRHAHSAAAQEAARAAAQREVAAAAL
eukprot:scaffold2.g7153.t1